MADEERIEKAVFSAIDELNQMLPEDRRLEKSRATHLLGKSGKLDSLGFVNFVVGVEEQISEDFGVAISLVDDKAHVERDNPFLTVHSLIDHISRLIDKKAAE